MRHVRNPQMELGEIRIEDIRINLKSRDDIPALLLGLQHLYADEETRTRLFALLEEYMLPGVDRTVGRPGMEMWRILVMGVVVQGLGCDFDRLHELVTKQQPLSVNPAIPQEPPLYLSASHPNSDIRLS